MGHDWILDVLADLRSYAAQNDLHALSEQADEALRVARAELAAQRLHRPPSGVPPRSGRPRPTGW